MPSGSGANSPQLGAAGTAPLGAAGAGERRLSNSSDCSTGSGNTRASSVDQSCAEYLQSSRSRVGSRAPPPRPSANPLQFVKVGPADLYRSAQEQLKRSEEVKKSKEVTKVEQEDWQSNLDNWKCSRRKRVEHIIEKVVEVKRLSDEATSAAARRRAKTFNEMIEERGGRLRRCPLALYAEEEATDFSDLGIGTSSTKSSLSEDCDAHSLASDGVELEKNHSDIDNMSGGETERNLRKFGSSVNEYDTCTTATISSPEPEEYTYEGAIENYKSRVISKTKIAILDSHFNNNLNTNFKDANDNLSNGNNGKFSVRCVDKPSLFENRKGNQLDSTNSIKKNIPKVDILKRRELFEKEASPDDNIKNIKRNSVDINSSKSIRDRLSCLGKSSEEIVIKDNDMRRKSTEINSVKDRLSLLKRGSSLENDNKVLNVNSDIFNTRSLKERLSSLQHQAEEHAQLKTNKVLTNDNMPTIKERLNNLDSFKSRDLPRSTPDRDVTFNAKLTNLIEVNDSDNNHIDTDVNIKENGELKSQRQIFHHSMDNFNIDTSERTFERIQSLEDVNIIHNDASPLSPNDTDREDSGVHTADGSCAVSQADDGAEINDLSSNIITEDIVSNLNETKEAELIADGQHQNCNKIDFESSDIHVDPSADQSFSDSHSTFNSQIDRAPSVLEGVPSIEENDKDDEETLKSVEQHDLSVHDALELAFREIDFDESDDPDVDGLMEQDSLESCDNLAVAVQPTKTQMEIQVDSSQIYDECECAVQNDSSIIDVDVKEESHSNMLGLPIYENVMYGTHSMMPLKLEAEDGIISFPLGPPTTLLEPPKEKPPPPPVDENLTNDSFKRVNSTRRIKKEIRNKRTSFLGIEGNDDSYLEPELKLAPRPDITTFLQEESRYEKLYKTSLSRELSANLAESCDSGLEIERANSADIWAKETNGSAQHSRHNSEPLTLTSVTSGEGSIGKNDYNIAKSAEQHWNDTVSSDNGDRPWIHNGDGFIAEEQLSDDFHRTKCETLNSHSGDDIKYRRNESDRIRALEEQVKEQQINGRSFVDYYDEGHSEEVLRVERELLQLEQEELKRQRINLLHKENQARKLNNRSLQDLSGLHFTENSTQKEYYPYANNQAQPHRKSMPNLVDYQPEVLQFVQPKSTDVAHLCLASNVCLTSGSNSAMVSKRAPPPVPPVKPLRSNEEQERENSVRSSRKPSAVERDNDDNNAPVQFRHSINKYNNHVYEAANERLSHHPMTRNTLQNLSAAPRSRLIQSADWMQAKRKSEPPSGYDYNQHWLIQEAEQRRIEQQQQLSARIRQQHQQASSPSQRTRHLPDSVIQTLTQRVHNMTSRSTVNSVPQNILPISPSHLDNPESGEKMLSVSGRKKCSHCTKELGRGAAMIIESLGLFYHLACFKCSVCGTRLGDGRAGADVRVRARRLHCHQCYSSDDGVNFSCV